MGNQIFKHFMKYCLIPFAKETTIHGVPLIVTPRIHPLERLFWIIMIFLSTVGATSLIISNWQRYNANPTVISIQKDYRNWHNLLPSVTGCFSKKFNPDFLDTYIEDTWGVTVNNTKYEYYADFVKAVANVSYHNLKEFTRFEQDPDLNHIDLLELAAKVHPKLTGTLVTFDTKRKTDWKLIMTEMGICFTVNSVFADILTFNVTGVNVTDPTADRSLLKCHYLNGLCYARYDSDPLAPVDFYVHSYLEVVHATANRPFHLRESEELEINYLMEETSSSPILRQLSPSQRKCRFEDEPSTNDLSVYSPTMCYIACRYRMVQKRCGCRPFFYHFMAGKICDIAGMVCVSKYEAEITKSKSEMNCHCPQSCHIVAYLPLPTKKATWTSGYFDQRITFRWGVLHPTTKYRRDILFSFEDLVVSLGGSLALFLGISFISLIELVYFLLDYLVLFFWKKDHKKKLSPQKPPAPIKTNIGKGKVHAKINVLPKPI